MNLFKQIFEFFKDTNKAVDMLMNEPSDLEKARKQYLDDERRKTIEYLENSTKGSACENCKFKSMHSYSIGCVYYYCDVMKKECRHVEVLDCVLKYPKECEYKKEE